MDTIKIKKRKTLLIAHRGLSGIERENTVAAFIAAGNRSYFGIETDVHKTADGKFVIIHDDTTERISEHIFNVNKTPFLNLRSLRLYDIFGKKREDLCIPTLEEYLRICKTYNKKAVLELKSPFEKKDINSILKIIRNEYKMSEMIFISFYMQNLLYVRELDKKAKLQLLADKKWEDLPLKEMHKNKIDIDSYYRRVNSDFVKHAHRNGFKVNCWTVDDKKTAEKLVKIGVDYITTNILE